MTVTSPGPGQHDPNESTTAELRQRLKDDLGGDHRTAIERHTDAVAASSASGGFTNPDDYFAALDLKKRGKASQAVLNGIANTDPGIMALANRPG